MEALNSEIRPGDVLLYPLNPKVLRTGWEIRGTERAPAEVVHPLSFWDNFGEESFVDLRYLPSGKVILTREDVFENREEAVLYAESLGKAFRELPFEPDVNELVYSGKIVPWDPSENASF